MIKNLLRMFVLCAVIIVPISMVVLATQGATLGMVAFLVLALIVPSVLRRHNRLEGLVTYPWRSGLYVYSWLWCLTFFFLGDSVIPFTVSADNTSLVILTWVGLFVVALFAMMLVNVILTMFFSRPRFNRWLDDSLDMAVYSLPIPMLLLGDVLFLNIPDPALAAQISAQVFGFLQLWLYGFVIWTMAVIAIYLHPKFGEKQGLRLGRIMLTALAWLAINGHLMYGWKPDFAMELLYFLMPVFQGNILVYITPGLLEFLVLGLSVGIGLRLEDSITNWQAKRVANK